jgi:lipopolysaccharide transport system permease protein
LAYSILIDIPSIYALLLPILILPLVFFGVGLSWTISAITVYIRDINQLVGFLIMALLFCTPIFYLKSAVPQNFQWLIEINPLANSIELSRQMLLFGKNPNMSVYIFTLVSSLVVCGIGYMVFKKCKKGFPDAI